MILPYLPIVAIIKNLQGYQYVQIIRKISIQIFQPSEFPTEIIEFYQFVFVPGHLRIFRSDRSFKFLLKFSNIIAENDMTNQVS